MSALANIENLGIELPAASVPAANYIPYVISGNQIYISGQIPQISGKFESNVGVVGEDFDIEQGKAIARLCGLNVISQASAAVGGELDQLKCIKLGVFVRSTSDFTQHPEIANGVSDLMVEVFGDNGKHTRFAVGASSLPRGVAVEVDAVFEIIG